MQVGGGLRDMVAVEQMLSVGASYVILGDRRRSQPRFSPQCYQCFCRAGYFGIGCAGRTSCGIRLAESEDVNIFDFLSQLHDLPPAAIIYTDIGGMGC